MNDKHVKQVLALSFKQKKTDKGGIRLDRAEILGLTRNKQGVTMDSQGQTMDSQGQTRDSQRQTRDSQENSRDNQGQVV